MELKSPISSTWKLFLLGCFCGGLVSLLFIDNAGFSPVELSTPLVRVLDDPPTSTTTSSDPTDSTTLPTDVNPPPIISTIFEPNVPVLTPKLPPPSISTIFEPNVPVLTPKAPPPSISTILEPNVALFPPKRPPPTVSTTLGRNVIVSSKVPSPNIMPISEANATSASPPTKVSPSTVSPISEPIVTDIGISMEKPIQEKKRECDMFNGKWVYREDEIPSYNAVTCPMLELGVTCQENGRSDFDYGKWRWEATDCDIPLFDGRDLLQRFRNKRLIIVGDSLNRNMWESLACLIYTSIPSVQKEFNGKNSGYRFLKVKDYNFSTEFYMVPFLTELDQKHKSGRRVLFLDKISSYANQWRGADVMVFNSAHWWTHSDRIKGWDLFQYKGNLTEAMPRDLAYKRGMTTWASWVKKNVDPTKTTVYFRSVSPTHYTQNQRCINATKPIEDETLVMGSKKNVLTDVIESIISEKSELRVKYLNITELSQYRVDAHPSIYTVKLTGMPSNQLHSRHGDCAHWCLPGLPDTWNRLLYASILSHTS